MLAGDRGNGDELLVIPSGSSRGGGLGHAQGIERGHVDLLPKNEEKWEAAVDPNGGWWFGSGGIPRKNVVEVRGTRLLDFRVRLNQ